MRSPRLLIVLFLAAGLLTVTSACGISEPTTASTDETQTVTESNPFEDIPEDPPPDEPVLVEVPDVADLDGEEAESTIESEGLTATYDENDPAGCTVTDQDPMAGDEVEESTEVALTLDCRQRDWENQEGEDWDAFNSGYTAGWDEGCEELFQFATDGRLFDDTGTEYTALDCQTTNPGSASNATDIPSDVPDLPEDDGRQLGATEGCEAFFSDTLYGSELVDEDDTTYSGLDCP